MKIRLIQRHCNFSRNSYNKERPDWFSKEKEFDSFISTLDERVDFYAFHDNGNGPIEDHFINHKNVKKISEKGGTDAKSFLNVLNWTIEQNFDDEDIIYFTEDDYIHRKNWIDILLEGFNYINSDYYTLYDHYDKYNLEMYGELVSKLFVSPSCHWRTTPSTTNTYACRFSTLKEDINLHIGYCDIEKGFTWDHVKFLHLFDKGRTLVSSIPGWSTHVEKYFLSPTISWESI